MTRFWLDPFSVPIEKDGNVFPAREKIVLGTGLSAHDDPDNEATVLELTVGVALDPPITITAEEPSQVPFTVKGAFEQAAHLQDWKNSAGTVIAAITAGGTILLAALAGPGAVVADSFGNLSSVSAGTDQVLYSDGSSIAFTGAPVLSTSLKFSSTTAAPLIGVVQRASDAACHDLTIAGQAPFGTATGSNRNPGNVILSIGAPIAGGSPGYAKISLSGTVKHQFGLYPLDTTYAALWLGNISPTSSNYALASEGANTYINATTSIYVMRSDVILAAFQNFSSANHLTWGLGFEAAIDFLTQATDTAAHSLTLQSQAPYASATGTNRNSGHVIANVPAAATGGATGYHKLTTGGVAQFLLRPFYQDGTQGGPTIWLHSRTPDANNYTISLDALPASPSADAGLYFNTPTFLSPIYFFTGGGGRASIDWDGTSHRLLLLVGAPGVIGMQARTNNSTVNDLTIQGQTPYASATGSNRNAGSIVLAVPSPASGGTEGSIKFSTSGTVGLTFSKLNSATWQLVSPTKSLRIEITDTGSYFQLGTTLAYLDSTTINFRDGGGGTTYGNWAGAGLRVGDATTATTTLDVQGSQRISGKLGIGIAPDANVQLRIDSGAAPNYSQAKITANGAGSLSLTTFAVDNVFIGFDADFSAGGFVARATTAAFFYKTSDKLAVYGNSGLSIGGGISVTARANWTLSTGYLRLGDNTAAGQQLELASGTIRVVSFATAGIVHNDSSGVFSSSTIVNADVNASAAIAYSKLNLTGSIVNADVNASAAIAYSKLALTGSIVNADVNASAAIVYSKLSLTGSIVNADVNASAAIAYSKLNLSASIVNADVSNTAQIRGYKTWWNKTTITGTAAISDTTSLAEIAIVGEGTYTITLPTVTDGRVVMIHVKSTAGVCSLVSPSGTINGGASINLNNIESMLLVCDGTDWNIIGFFTGDIAFP
jgi:hypothetical protein